MGNIKKGDKLKEKDKVKIQKRNSNQRQKTTKGGQILEEIESNTHNFVKDLQNNTENMVNSLLNIFNSNDNYQKQEMCKKLNMDSCPISLNKQDAQQIVEDNYPSHLPSRTTVPKPMLTPTPLPRHNTIAPTPLPRRNTMAPTPLPRRKTVQTSLLSPIQPQTQIQPWSQTQLMSPIPHRDQIKAEEDIFSKFNTIYNNLIDTIFEKYKSYNNLPSKFGVITDEKLRGILFLMLGIPTITKDLTRLTTGDSSTFNNSYRLLLNVVKDNCLDNWLKEKACNMTSKGVNIGEFYKLLKNNSIYLKSQQPIPDSVLLNFIHLITPKIIINFSKVTDKDVSSIITEFTTFAENHNIDFQLGGKKSQSLYANILGKLKKLYKFPKDRKKYVKHNGKLITINEYKKLKDKSTSNKKKIILGKERVIYKVPGSKKDHVKYKNKLITVNDFERLMKK